MNWLQGGPFYELSIIVNNDTNKNTLIQSIFKILIDSSSILMCKNSDDTNEQAEQFIAGYWDDSTIYRTCKLNIKVNIAGTRKAIVYVNELSESLVQIDFCFYGDYEDAPEWNQIGLKRSDKPDFLKFFRFIINKFNPLLGLIAYEDYCTSLFQTKEAYPHDDYCIEKLSLEMVKQSLNNFDFAWIRDSVFSTEKHIEFTAED